MFKKDITAQAYTRHGFGRIKTTDTIVAIAHPGRIFGCDSGRAAADSGCSCTTWARREGTTKL